MNEALKLAVEGGWKYEDFCDGKGCQDRHILLDPLFWQAIGKSLGWNRLAPYELINKNIPEWHYHWHRFIDHLAAGKGVDSFFADLLSNQK